MNPSPRLPSAVLGDLLKLADLVLLHPYSAFGRRDAIDAIAAEIGLHIARPCEGVRHVDDLATWLVQGLSHVADGETKAIRDKWVEISRFLMTCVRENEQAALCSDLASMATSEGAGGGASR